MLSTHDHQPMLHEAGDAEIARYRPLSKLALAGLFLGLAAPLAVIEPALYLVPLAGVAVNAAALWTIARNAPALLGRKAALVGLVLSLALAAGAPGHWITYRWLLRREACQVAGAWFELLREGQPQKAFQLTRPPSSRQPLDDSLWDYYKQNPNIRRELETYVAPSDRYDTGPRLVRTLLTLGKTAQVRYFGTEGQGRAEGIDSVYQVYTVTYEEGGRPTTFFVGVELKRFLLRPTGRAAWQVVRTDAAIRPPAFGGKKEDI